MLHIKALVIIYGIYVWDILVSSTPPIVIALYGDWGVNTADFLNGARYLNKVHTNVTILLGDNFYDDGVKSVDDGLWEMFDLVKNSSDIFYPVVGNHDYRGSVDSQVKYSSKDPKWQMPALYYYKKIPLDSVHYICGLFIDTYNLNDLQLRWAQGLLNSTECQSHGTYRIVFGHYPVHTVGIFHADESTKRMQRHLKPLLEQNKVHAYIAGHEHDMQVFHDNGVVYLISGSLSDKYAATAESADDDKILWRNVGTPGYLRMLMIGANSLLTYHFVDIENGGILHSGSINETNFWRMDPQGNSWETADPQWRVLILSLSVSLVLV
jgi:predicted phosphodiesterase